MTVMRWDDMDASDVDDFTIDFSAELGAETIAACTWSATPSALTIGADSFTATTATVRLSAGTSGTDYSVTATATTSGGRVLQRSRKLLVTEL